MKILHIRTLNGPNTYHSKPVLMMKIDLEEFAEVASSDMPDFNQRLVDLLPGLAKHRCSPGYEGGFLERLERGTYFGHMIEHIALELSTLSEIEVGYGKTVYGDAPGIYLVVVRFQSEAGMKFLLEKAVELAQAVAKGHPFALSEAIEAAKATVRENKLGPSTQAIVTAAERRNIPWQRLNEYNLIQFGYGKNRKIIQATTTSLTSDIGVDIAQDKDLTKKILSDAGLRVPEGVVVSSIEDALQALRDFKGPAVVKPADGHQGKGVSLNVATSEQMEKAFAIANAYSDEVIIEELFQGKDYRILVVGGKMVAASLRKPACVVGDGKSTISELIAQENLNPLRGDGHEAPLTKIKIDACSEIYLKRAGISLDHVPQVSETIYLRETANLSTGGCAEDVTDLVHPEIKAMAERASRIVGLDISGIDFMAEDISLPFQSKNSGIIEVNAGPGIRMHHYPSKGKARDVGAAIIAHLYPEKSEARIPIISVTGTNGKTTVTRLIQHLLKSTGKVVGMTTSSGIYIDGYKVADGDTTGPVSAKTVLCDPAVEVAVLETARGGITRRGLGFDWCDVGVMTNIQADHIGQDGIESLEDILRIKSLVAERVRVGGTLVLNLDDPVLAEFAVAHRDKLMASKIAYFSLKGLTPELKAHVRKGCTAYYLCNDEIYEFRNGQIHYFTNASDIPLTVAGTARFQIANVLAAIASARALGLSIEQVVRGLLSFHSDQNSGRANIYKVEKGHVIVDYGHNPEALRAISEMVSHWKVSRVTGVITAPGDRSDAMIQMSGTVAARAFDRVIIREDEDLRGRPPGETAGLLCAAIREADPNVHCEIHLDSHEALEKGMGEMIEGEVLVYFYDEIKSVEEVLANHQAQITETLPGLSRNLNVQFSKSEAG